MNIIMPSAELAQQAGYMPNVKGILKQVCELQGIPFNDMYIPIDLTMASESVGQVPAPSRLGGQPAVKQTTNTRVSRPGATREGNMNKIVNANAALLGKTK